MARWSHCVGESDSIKSSTAIQVLGLQYPYFIDINNIFIFACFQWPTISFGFVSPGSRLTPVCQARGPYPAAPVAKSPWPGTIGRVLPEGAAQVIYTANCQ